LGKNEPFCAPLETKSKLLYYPCNRINDTNKKETFLGKNEPFCAPLETKSKLLYNPCTRMNDTNEKKNFRKKISEKKLNPFVRRSIQSLNYLQKNNSENTQKNNPGTNLI
jgi:hypothetical protein